MEVKKKTPVNTITRDVKYLAEPTGNIYETVVLLYKRANQIALEEKKELAKKLEDFRSDRDTMDEVFENREQIEISKYYEKLPKPDLIAITEFEDGRKGGIIRGYAEVPSDQELRFDRLSGCLFSGGSRHYYRPDRSRQVHNPGSTIHDPGLEG